MSSDPITPEELAGWRWTNASPDKSLTNDDVHRLIAEVERLALLETNYRARLEEQDREIDWLTDKVKSLERVCGQQRGELERAEGKIIALELASKFDPDAALEDRAERMQARAERAEARVREYESLACFSGAPYRQESGAETKPIDTVKLGELFARAERAEAALVEACRQSEEAQLRERGSDSDWSEYGAKSDAEVVADVVGYDLAAQEGE